MTVNDLFLRSVRLKEPDEQLKNSYVFTLPAVRQLEQEGGLAFSKRVTLFVGENGTGKSTLLEAIAIACGFNPEGGTRNFDFASKETHSPLYQALSVTRGVTRPRDGFFLRAESFYNVASEVDRLNGILPPMQCYGDRSLHDQSHGEGILSLVLNRFGENGLYLLDEPEAALSPASQLALLARICDLAKTSQLLIATHSPILLACPNADVFELTEHGMTRTDYKQTTHYTLTKQFLNCPERILGLLLQE